MMVAESVNLKSIDLAEFGVIVDCILVESRLHFIGKSCATVGCVLILIYCREYLGSLAQRRYSEEVGGYEILETVNKDTAKAAECKALADEVEAALKQYATYNHPEFGEIYAFEVDGFGNHMLMDDANAPSLLSLPYLSDVDVNDPVYQNTRRFVWSESNPYFFKGSAGEGIGGPHIGYDMVWPMSIMMKAFTSTDDAEIADCLRMLLATDAGTVFIHESFNKNDAADFTRPWFAWQNTLFGELIVKLYNEGKLDLLNSI